MDFKISFWFFMAMGWFSLFLAASTKFENYIGRKRKLYKRLVKKFSNDNR